MTDDVITLHRVGDDVRLVNAHWPLTAVFSAAFPTDPDGGGAWRVLGDLLEFRLANARAIYRLLHRPDDDRVLDGQLVYAEDPDVTTREMG